MKPTSGVARRFAGVAERVPERVAVCVGGTGLSYAGLAGAAGARAGLLLDAGVRPGTRVGLVTGHGAATIAAILGTLAAGCAYVPLDPAFPAGRLAYQAGAAGTTVVLADPEHIGVAEALCRGGSRLLVTGDGTAPLPDPRDDDVDELAYVLFTSGSTGRPKAVGQTRRNLLHVVDNQITALGITGEDRLSLLASFGFDAAIPDLYPALLTGAAVVPVDVRTHGIAEAARTLARHRATIYHSTPTVYRALVETGIGLAPVRTVLLGGERATYEDVRLGPGTFAPGCVFVNGYGATEMTFAAQYRLTADVARAKSGPLPIGTALPGYAVEVAGGEILVRSPHLADGYLNEPGLAFGEDGGVRTYRTGDAGEVRHGQLVCLGRLDRQLKIRGFRVEPAEVELGLKELPGVTDARAIARDGELLAYVVAEGSPDVADLRASLAGRLPDYAMPSAIGVVGAFPLTVTGKLDEQALPDPRGGTAGEEPHGEAERRVHALWAEVLGHRRFGRTEGFFEVGGHSLLLNRVQQRLADEFGADLPLVSLIDRPTVAGHAALVSGVDEPEQAGRVSGSGQDLIAVVGLACRFPGADDPAAFWSNLCAGVDAIHDHTDDELAALGIGEGLRRDPGHVKAGGRVEGVTDFDAGFFGFTAEEAARTDPQHRLFLEAAWQAMEDAGRDPATEAGPVGVFTASSVNRYFLFHLFGNPAVTGDADPDDWESRLLSRQLTDHLPGQVAYRLGLTGPALAVQSACSSSLAAVGLAAQSLAEYRCDLALAGGVSVTWPRYKAGGLASPDGRCRAFDAAAAGAGFSSGAGVVVLRRLADALADRDHVYAVLPGWGIANDGPDRAGYAVPSPAGQAAAIAEALAVSEVDPEEVGFVEAHGSGTPLGDAIEVTALNRVYKGLPEGSCALGSVKTNIGHLDAAAGVAGLIKATLAVRHGVIPPNLHFTTPHPEIDLGPFHVPVKTGNWPGDRRRVAGVSAFGLGGTNVHVVVEEAPRAADRPEPGGGYVLPVSARDRDALQEALSRLRDHLTTGSPVLADVAYTLAVGRRAFGCRAAVVAAGVEDAVEALGAVTPGEVAGSEGELRALAEAWVRGEPVDWAARYEGRGLGRVPLPTYPFQRVRCWIDPPSREGSTT